MKEENKTGVCSHDNCMCEHEKTEEKILQSSGERPENFEESPHINTQSDLEPVKSSCGDDCSCDGADHQNACGCGHSHSHSNEKTKWNTMKYAVIDWDDMNVRRMFFTLLTQTFDKWGKIRGDRVVFGGTETYIEETKVKNPNFLDKENPKISIMRMIFNNKKRGVMFSFDMTEQMAFTILKGSQRNIFRLFMQKFDSPFRKIAEEHMEAHKKAEEEKAKAEEEKAKAEEEKAKAE